MESRITTENFEIENINPQIASLYPKNSDIPYTGFDKNNLILDFGEKTKKDLTTCIFNYNFTDNQYAINSTSGSCGCTKVEFIPTDDGNQQFKVIYENAKIGDNINKAFSLYLKNDKIIKFNLIMNM